MPTGIQRLLSPSRSVTDPVYLQELESSIRSWNGKRRPIMAETKISSVATFCPTKRQAGGGEGQP